MIFDIWFKQYKVPEQKPTWEYSEKPVYNTEHKETAALIQDIITKLDEIKKLVDEMKETEGK